MSKTIHPSQNQHYLWPDAAERERYLPTDKFEVEWGAERRRQPLRMQDMGQRHYFFAGMSGTGKTTLLKLFAKSVLRTNRHDFYRLRYRSLINDPKREWVGDLLNWGFHLNDIIISNPFDARSSAWDLATDLCQPAVEKEFVNDICSLYEMRGDTKDQRADSPYWRTLGSQSIAAVIAALRTARGNDWELRDLIQCACTPNARDQALRVTPMGQKVYQKYFGPDAAENSRANSDATITGMLSPLEIPAALWHTARTKFSILEWRKRGSILVLGYAPRGMSQTQPVNFLLLKSAIEATLEPAGEEREDLTWFVLDELSNIGVTPKLDTLLDMGRGKGARVVVTCLGYHDFLKAFAFNDTLARAAMAQIHNKAILRMDEPYDRDYFQRLQGRHWTEQESQSISRSPQGSNQLTISPVEKARFDYEGFDGMHLASSADGIDAVFMTNGQLPHRPRPPAKLTGEQIRGRLLVPPAGKHSRVEHQAFIPRDSNDQVLQPWGEEDFARFGFKMQDDEIPDNSAAKARKKPSSPSSTNADPPDAKPSSEASDKWELRW